MNIFWFSFACQIWILKQIRNIYLVDKKQITVVWFANNNTTVQPLNAYHNQQTHTTCLTAKTDF